MNEDPKGGFSGSEAASQGPPLAGPCPSAPPKAPPRLRQPDRQLLLPAMTLEQLLEPDHLARRVWRYVQALDLSLLYHLIEARLGGSGRPAIDPRLLVALWLYATLEGVVSARRLAELCVRHHAYRWLCGGIAVNAHTLSDFRVEQADFLEQLFRHSVELLRSHGLVALERTAQDGMRVRASAGAASFHRQATLQRQLEEAQALVKGLQEALGLPPAQTAAGEQAQPPELIVGQEDEDGVPDSGGDRPDLSKQQAAEVRAAVERLHRARQALRRLPEMEAKKKADEKDEARVSSTDPEATVMKMPDGGYRPAYNIHYDSDCGHQVIVGVEVLTTGSDQGQLQPMLAQVEGRFGKRPKEKLADGGFVKLEEIEGIQKGEEGKSATKVYAPVPVPKDAKRDRYAPLPGDSQEVAEWRARMGTEEAKEIYKDRAATAECVNAQARNRGLVRLLVRGVKKVKAVALWFAAAHNMARSFALLPS